MFQGAVGPGVGEQGERVKDDFACADRRCESLERGEDLHEPRRFRLAEKVHGDRWLGLG